MKRVLLVYFLIVSAASQIFCSDFKDSSHGNKVEFTFTGCSTKVIKGNKCWLKDWDGSYKKNSDDDPPWTSGSSSFSFDENIFFYKYSRKFHNYLLFGIKTTSCSVSCFGYHDNICPQADVVCDLFYRDGVYWGKDGCVVKIYVPKDICDHPGIDGCGIKSMIVSVDGEDRFFDEIPHDCLEVSLSGDGMHAVSVTLFDELGNKSEENCKAFMIENTAPSVFTEKYSQKSMWIRDNVELKAEAEDYGSGLDCTSWKISFDDGKTWKFLDDSYVNENECHYVVGEGVSDVRFSISDNAGNVSVSDRIEVRMDRTPPVISCDAVAGKKWINLESFSFSAIDEISGVDEGSYRYVLNGKKKSGNKLSALKEGRHSVIFSADDKSGNSASSDVMEFGVDVTPPVIETFPSILNCGTYVPVFSDALSAVDLSSVKYRFDGGSWISGKTVELTEGYNNLEFSLSDNAGNTVLQKGKILLDSTPPELSFDFPECTNQFNLKLSDFVVHDEYASDIKVTYVLNGKDRNIIDDPKNPCVSLYSLPEGKNLLEVYADDGNGNVSVCRKDFILDRTCPVINDISVFNGNNAVEDGDYADPFETISFTVSAYDGTASGFEYPLCFYYSLNGSEQEIFDGKNAVTIKAEDGLNILKVKAVDLAGNESEIKVLKFRIDNEKPGRPSISSLNFIYADKVERSCRIKSGSFDVKSSFSGSRTSRNLIWELFTCGLKNDGSVDEKTLTAVEGFNGIIENCHATEKIKIHDIADNYENQFYCLRVYAVGENRIKSDHAIYTFRIDTKPVEHFDVFFESHADELKWYSNRKISCSYSKGSDASGIALIEYSFDEKIWHEIYADEGLRFSLCVPDGKNTIFFRCMDKAGNYSTVVKSVNVDSVPPVFEDDFILQCYRSDASAIDLEWGSVSDSLSGMDNIQISVMDLLSHEEKTLLFESQETKAEIPDIESSHDYRIIFSASDKAGNHVERCIFSLSTENSGKKIPFVLNDEFKGVAFSVKAEFDSDKNISVLRPGSSVEFGNCTFLIEDGELYSDGRVSYAESVKKKNGSYCVRICGIDLFFESVEFQRETGLELKGCFYESEVSGGTVYFENLSVGFPDDYVLNGVSRKEVFSDYSDGSVKISGIDQLCIVDSINFLQESILLTLGNNKEYKIPAAHCDMDGKNLYALLSPDQDFILENGAVLSLLDSFYYQKKLFVRKALMNFLYEGKNYRLSIENFFYDVLSGKFYPDECIIKCFDSEENEIERLDDSFMEFSVSDIYLTESGCLKCKGMFKNNLTGIIDLDEIFIDNNGLSYDESSLDEFDLELFGFPLKVYDGGLTILDGESSLNVRKGTLNVLGKKFQVEGLILSLEKNDFVLKDGYSKDSADINCDYGSSVEVSDLRITRDGLSAAVKVPLPSCTEKILFEDGKIFQDGSFICRNEKEITCLILGYKTSVSLSQFDGKVLSLENGKIDVSSDDFFFEQKKIHFMDFSKIVMSFDSVQESSFMALDGISYRRDGWSFSFSVLNFGLEGFSGTVEAKSELCGISGFFEEFKISRNMITSARHDDTSELMYIFYGDQTINLPECEFCLKDGVLSLSCENPSLDFFDAAGKKKINLGKTFVFSDGSFYGSLGNQEDLLVESTNGLKMHAAKAKLSGNSLLFCGTVEIEALNAKIQADDFDFYLDENFRLLTAKNISEIEYVYAGWNIKGRKAYFRKNGDFKISENSVEFRKNVLDLGDLMFDENFELKKEFRIEQNKNFDLFGSTSYLSCTTFSKNGLSGSMYYKFPEYLKGGKFFLSDVHFFQDGSFFSKDFVEDTKITNENVSADFKRVTVGDSKLKIEGFSMESKGDEKFSFEIPESYITDNGLFVIENKLIPPFQIWGCTVIIKEISLSETGIGFDGNVILSEKAPGVLSNKKIHLKNFLMNWSGEILSFEICDEEGTEIPLLGSWRLGFSGFKILYFDGNPYIVFKNSRIVFPGQFSFCEALCIDEVKFNLRNLDFDFEKIRLSMNSRFSIGGLSFYLSEIYFSREHNIGVKCGVDFSDESYPEFLRSAGGVSAEFEITPEGDISVFKMFLKDLNGKILNDVDALRIEDGTVSFTREKGRYIADVSGNLFFSECVDGDFNDLKLKIESFKFDISSMMLLDLKASGRCLNACIGAVKLNDISASVEWGKGKEKLISLSGNIILPDSLPTGLSGAVVSIKDFKIGAGGEILSFDASMLMDDDIRIGKGLILDKVMLSALYKDKNPTFDLKGRFCFDKEVYTSGIGGISSDIHLVFSEKGIESVQADVELEDILLFEALQTEQLRMSASLSDGILLFDFSGAASIIDNKKIPEGLSGTRFEIKKFQIDVSGKIIDMEIRGSTKDFVVFDCVEIGSPEAEIILDNNIFMISFGGCARLLSEKLPQNIRNSKFWISKMILSFDGEVIDFDLCVDTSVEFTILSGLSVFVDSLRINHRGFGCQAHAVMNFKGPMKNTEIKLTKFFMEWNGTVSELEAGLKSTEIEIAGFKGSVKNLVFEKDSGCRDGYVIKLEECMLCLPENAGDKGNCYLAIKNAQYRDGDFTGEFESSDFTINIADFILTLENPQIDFEEKEIKFQRVYMQLPEMLGSVIFNLYHVKISASDGLLINGGIIFVPDFSIGNNIGFRNVGVAFVCRGEKYSVTGTGAVSIPGTGEMEAKLTFCDTCDMYPLGLQQAYFSFEVSAGKGLPLGTTGLYLTGIRGGLAYGKPDDVPSQYRKFFEKDGCRIQLGLTVADQTGGSVVKITPDTWIDVWNHSWVFDGSAAVLKGSLDIKADVMASYSKYGFCAGMKFRIVFVEGEMQFYVFQKDGSLKFSGTASIGIVIRKGKIYKKKMPWKIPNICIPWKDIKLGEIDSEFGSFTNGRVGFKAYISVFGYHLGVFASNKGIDLGNVSGYSVLKPVYNDREMMVVNYAEKDHELPGYEDNVFEVPDRLQGVIFACSYFEIKPDLEFIAPDGKVYTEKSEGVDVVYGEDCFYVSVSNPQSGIWRYRADGYDFSLCGIEAVFVGHVPEIKINDVIMSDGKLSLTGHASECGKKVCVYAVSKENGFETEIGFSYVDSEGNFNGVFGCEVLYEGIYRILVRLEDDGCFDFAKDVFKDDVEIIRSWCELSVPEGLRCAAQDGVVLVKWRNVDFAKACGFELLVEKDGKECLYDAGNSLEFVFMNSDFKSFSSRIRSYGSRGEKSEWSAPVFLTGFEENSDCTFIVSSENETEIVKDHHASFVLDVCTDSSHVSGGKSVFIQVDFVDIPEHMEVVMEKEVEVKNGKASLTCHAYADKKCAEGTYELKCRISYWGKKEKYMEYTHKLNVVCEKLCIESLSENSICPENDNEITVFGTGLNDGTRYFLDGRELCVVQDDFSSLSQKIVSIPAHKARGESILTAVGPDSQISEISIENRASGYFVYPRIDSLLLKKGTRGFFPLRIVRSPEFNGAVDMFLTTCSDGLSVSVPYVGSGSNVEIAVYADKSCITGEKKISLAYEDGKFVDLSIFVADDSYFEPAVKQVVPFAAFPGDKVSVYGSNFGENAALFFNGTEISLESCSDTRIEFLIPEDCGDGSFYIVTKEGRSRTQRISLKKKEEGISLENVFGNADEYVIQKRKSIFEKECPESMCWNRNEWETEKCCGHYVADMEPLGLEWTGEKINDETHILSASGLIFVADKFSVSAYSVDGRMLWNKEFNHKVKMAAVFGNRLYVLSVDGFLYSIRVPDFEWEVVLEEVLGITGNCSFLLVQKDSSTRIYSSTEVDFLGEIPVFDYDAEKTVWRKNQAFFWNGRIMYNLLDGTVFFKSKLPIDSVHATEDGFEIESGIENIRLNVEGKEF